MAKPWLGFSHVGLLYYAPPDLDRAAIDQVIRVIEVLGVDSRNSSEQAQAYAVFYKTQGIRASRRTPKRCPSGASPEWTGAVWV